MRPSYALNFYALDRAAAPSGGRQPPSRMSKTSSTAARWSFCPCARTGTSSTKFRRRRPRALRSAADRTASRLSGQSSRARQPGPSGPVEFGPVPPAPMPTGGSDMRRHRPASRPAGAANPLHAGSVRAGTPSADGALPRSRGESACWGGRGRRTWSLTRRQIRRRLRYGAAADIRCRPPPCGEHRGPFHQDRRRRNDRPALRRDRGHAHRLSPPLRHGGQGPAGPFLEHRTGHCRHGRRARRPPVHRHREDQGRRPVGARVVLGRVGAAPAGRGADGGTGRRTGQPERHPADPGRERGDGEPRALALGPGVLKGRSSPSRS